MSAASPSRSASVEVARSSSNAAVGTSIESCLAAGMEPRIVAARAEPPPTTKPGPTCRGLKSQPAAGPDHEPGQILVLDPARGVVELEPPAAPPIILVPGVEHLGHAHDEDRDDEARLALLVGVAAKRRPQDAPDQPGLLEGLASGRLGRRLALGHEALGQDPAAGAARDQRDLEPPLPHADR